MSSQSSPIIPSADQLGAARIAQWHQNGEALLTFENLRSWINVAGLALFAPRAQQLPAPAPSMVEAVLGTPNAAPSLADTEQARSLLARLVADNAALPLNLLGSPTAAGTEVPDFIATTAVFPYIFTLRGDKAWKQPPATSGPTKVSPLALATYTLLTEKGPLTAYDLVTQLGKEVTEAAVLRALTELWQHLRVLPIPQIDGTPTLWELTTTRFTKQMKSGANAGQPTALSALISLYLGQSLVATEEEIEVFLSPVAARSRIRDVVHALIAARQLETIAIEGKTVLHVAGSLPAFLGAPAPADAEASPEAPETEVAETTETDSGTPAPRIKKFVPTPRKIGTGYVTKFGRKPEGAPTTPRERRPFTRESNRPDRPSFTKPWAEEKADRLAAAQRPASLPDSEEGATTEQAPRKYSSDRLAKRPSFGDRPSFSKKPSFGDRPSFSKKPGFSSRPSFGDKPRFGSRPSFGDRPRFGQDSDSRPPRREYKPRADASSGDFAPRKPFSKSASYGGKREGGFSKPSFSRDSDSRPPRREFKPREEGSGPRRFGSKPGFPSRNSESAGAGDRERPTYRKFDAPRFDKPRFDKPRGDRPARFDSDRPARREGASGSTGFSRKPGFGDKKPYSRSGSSDFAGKPSFKGKSTGGFAGKKPFGKSAGYKGKPSTTGKPASTFDKFKDNKKPFGKRPPARKFKPEEGSSAE